MAAGSWQDYESLHKKVLDGVVISSNTFKALLLSSSHTIDLANDDELADITAEELSVANGYARATLSNVAITRSGVNTKFSCDPITFGPATGGGFAARYCAIYDDTASGDPLVTICELDSTPADVTINAGVLFQLTPHANGVFRYVT